MPKLRIVTVIGGLSDLMKTLLGWALALYSMEELSDGDELYVLLVDKKDRPPDLLPIFGGPRFSEWTPKKQRKCERFVRNHTDFKQLDATSPEQCAVIHRALKKVIKAWCESHGIGDSRQANIATWYYLATQPKPYPQMLQNLRERVDEGLNLREQGIAVLEKPFAPSYEDGKALLAGELSRWGKAVMMDNVLFRTGSPRMSRAIFERRRIERALNWRETELVRSYHYELTSVAEERGDYPGVALDIVPSHAIGLHVTAMENCYRDGILQHAEVFRQMDYLERLPQLNLRDPFPVGTILTAQDVKPWLPRMRIGYAYRPEEGKPHSRTGQRYEMAVDLQCYPEGLRFDSLTRHQIVVAKLSRQHEYGVIVFFKGKPHFFRYPIECYANLYSRWIPMHGPEEYLIGKHGGRMWRDFRDVPPMRRSGYASAVRALLSGKDKGRFLPAEFQLRSLRFMEPLLLRARADENEWVFYFGGGDPFPETQEDVWETMKATNIPMRMCPYEWDNWAIKLPDGRFQIVPRP